MSTKYQVLPPTAPVPAPDDVLERLVRAGARTMLQDALEAEVDDFLGRRRYQRTQDKRGHRNGHLPERSIGVGMGAVEISLPRVSDVPPEVSPDGFHSEIVSRYQRRSRTQARLLARLYLEGLSSGDFESSAGQAGCSLPCMRPLHLAVLRAWRGLRPVPAKATSPFR